MSETASRYLDLCTGIKNKRAEEVAHMQMGKLFIIEKDYKKGVKSFRRALKVAKEVEDAKGYDEAKCCFGFTTGQSKLHDHFKSILNNIPANTNQL